MKREGGKDCHDHPSKKCHSCSLTSLPEFTRLYCTGAQAVPPSHLCYHLHVSPCLETAQTLLSYKAHWTQPS